MRRVLILSACIIFGSTVAANAYYWTDGYVGATVTELGGSRAEVDIWLLNNASYPGGKVTAIQGTWDLTNPPLPSPHHAPHDNPAGATFYVGGAEAGWQIETTNTYQPTVESYINFDSYDASATWSKTGTLPHLTAFQGKWYTDYSYLRLSPTGINLLSSMVIDGGSWVHFNGSISFNNNGTPSTLPLEFMVPEPGTLAMLIGMALTLFGLARFRRR
jgi:hypothetical protein